MSDVNPKELAATRDAKAPVDLLEQVADEAIARALHTGAMKYGRKNYRYVGEIFASTYGAAIRRHIGAWLGGEDLDPESGLSHLAHIGSNLHVLFGAMDAGTFVNDRGYQPPTEEQAARSDASNGQYSSGGFR